MRAGWLVVALWLGACGEDTNHHLRDGGELPGSDARADAPADVRADSPPRPDDAGVPADSAPPHDGGSAPDGSAPIDGGIVLLDGPIIGPDATAPSDGGTEPSDGAVVPTDGTVVPSDAGPGSGSGSGSAEQFFVIHDLSGTIGYTNADGAAAAILFTNGTRAATCRVGHTSVVDQLPLTACPSPDVLHNVVAPVTPSAHTTDGSYRFDIHYVDVDGVTRTHTSRFYIHRTLNGAATCPNKPATFPSDQAIFAAAVQPFDGSTLAQPPPWLDANGQGTLPHAVAFAGPRVTPPFYALAFTGVTLSNFSGLAIVDPTDANQASAVTLDASQPQDFELPMRSLRHRLALNADGTLALIVRSYESRSALTRRAFNPGTTGPAAHVCDLPTKFGTGTFETRFACGAIVLNVNGEGFCMQIDEDSGAVSQAVFSRSIVGKLMAQSVSEDLPQTSAGTLWGPKLYSDPDTVDFPDSVFELPFAPKQHSRAVILRP